MTKKLKNGNDKRAFKYRVLLTDGSVLDLVAHMSCEPTLAEIKGVVEPHLGGADMEHVRVLNSQTRSGPQDMFVDELSVMKHLPRNEAATEIYRAAWLRRHPEDDPEAMPYIAGPAVIFDDVVWT